MESRKKSQISYPISDEEIIELYWMRDENAIKETDKKQLNKYIICQGEVVINITGI